MAIDFPENQVIQVGPYVWVRNMVDNACWSDLGDGVVVIDSLEDTATMEKQIPADIRETANKPMKWLVNTHWHPDHTANNAAWAREGATVIAHESVGPAQEEANGLPNITFSDRYVLKGSERQIEMEYMGGTHTPWDSVVYFPWARVLHIADLFGWGMIPLSSYDAQKTDLLCSYLKRVLEYDADTLIPGHGPLVRPDHIRRWLTYIDDLRDRVIPLAEAGESLDEIERRVPVPDDMEDWWKLPDWKHRHNLQLMVRHYGA